MSDASAPQPIFQEKRFGFEFTVYPNRIETSEGAFGATAKKDTILNKSITEVAVVGMTRKLQITTQDGRKRQYNLGGNAEKAKQAIVGVL